MAMCLGVSDTWEASSGFVSFDVLSDKLAANGAENVFKVLTVGLNVCR